MAKRKASPQMNLIRRITLLEREVSELRGSIDGFATSVRDRFASLDRKETYDARTVDDLIKSLIKKS